jgi:hypothetical protein
VSTVTATPTSESRERVRAHAASIRAFLAEAESPIPPRLMANVLQAVADLERATEPDATIAALNRLRLRVVELQSNYEPHPDGLARALSVMRRCAADLLGDDDGAPVAAWAARLESGDGGPVAG